ncbi:PLP-dependent aminotransferase family protein [Streptomyces sp. NPDC018031]|uniref:MocR-like pyridoxine biosynthesis transcription factor PdxR n=1 Tax=Streptomyces sp. NPDC018031 TaxID=3365033 RepID=UPI0037B90627
MAPPCCHDGRVHRSNDDATDRSNGSPPGPGSDFLQLDIGEAPTGGRADWLTRQLRLALADGRLPVGSRLPATRVLAAELRVSRGVITEAYQRLAEDGHTVGRGRKGTIVVAVPAPSGRPLAPRAPAAGTAAPHRGVPGPRGPSAEVFPAVPGPDVYDRLRTAPARIDLTPGMPDLGAFPRGAWLRAERSVLSGLASSHLGYGDPRGAPALREAVAGWLARNRGVHADPAEILIVTGTAQTLTLLGEVLREAGITRVAVEDPGSLGARQHLSGRRLGILPVPVDTEGIRVDALRATGAPAVLVTPAHQFPTGVVLSGSRRRELMRWAEETGGLVIEDDYDAEHRYDRPPVPALRSMLPQHVVYAGSVSKLLAPALRIGWVLAPPGHHEALTAAKRFADLGSAVLPQLVLARLMESGELERQLRLLRRRHHRRRDAMIQAMAAQLPGAVVHGAAAGLHLMVTFDADLDDTELAAAALAHGVKVQPLSWHTLGGYRPGLVLGYAANDAGTIRDGVSLLGTALRSLVGRAAAPA